MSMGRASLSCGDTGALPNLQGFPPPRHPMAALGGLALYSAKIARPLPQCSNPLGTDRASSTLQNGGRQVVTTCHHLVRKVVTEKHQQFQCCHHCHHLSPPFSLHRMWGMERVQIHIPIWGKRKLGVEVVTVVTALISLDFSCHHLVHEVVTDAKVVTK